MQEKKSNTYLIENIIRQKDLFILYKGLIESNVWTLNRTSIGGDFGTFPGFIIQEGSTIYNSYWCGYFMSFFEKINFEFEKKYNFNLPSKIKRIHLVAKNDSSYTEFHCDTQEPNSYTIVGFLTPVWSQNWGGELMVEDEKINFEPGKFIAFKSNLRHNGLGQNQKIPYWRISINYVVGD